MSPFLYRSRLQWEGYHGVAKHDGVLVELRSCPQFLPGIRLISIDYSPEVRVTMVQAFNTPRRDMSRAEVTLCQALLERMAIAAREALETPCP